MKIAVVQESPVILDRHATLQRAAAALHAAADAGAELIVFPEAFVPGYPLWIWWLRPGADYALSHELHRRLLAESVDLARGDLALLQEAAAARRVTVVCGVHERNAETSGATLFNTLVTIDRDGIIANRHRKLVPTNPERMVWGQGDASGLRVVDLGGCRVGGLICWENYMPLARFALYGQGVDVLVAATWDSGDTWLASMRHIAAEGRCWVIGAGCALTVDDIPASFPERDRVLPDTTWLNPGDSVVVAPGGQVTAGPLHEMQGFLFAEIDPAAAADDHRTLDVAGHYARPDIFRLHVDRSPQRAVTFE